MFTIITTTSARLPRLLTVSCTLSLYSASWQNLTQFSAHPLHSSTILSVALSGSSVNSKVLFMVIYFLKYSLSLSCPLNLSRSGLFIFFFHILYLSGPGSGVGFSFKIFCYLEIIPLLLLELLKKKKNSHMGSLPLKKYKQLSPKSYRRSHISFQSSVHFSTSLYSKLAKLLPILNYPHSCFWKKESAK